MLPCLSARWGQMSNKRGPYRSLGGKWFYFAGTEPQGGSRVWNEDTMSLYCFSLQWLMRWCQYILLKSNFLFTNLQIQMQINGVITTGPSQTSTRALTMFFNPPILTTPHILGNMCNLSHISLQCFLIFL